MSRPHDWHRNFFPFGNPFRIIRPRGSYLSPKLLSLLNSFEKTLAEGLTRLKPKETSDILTLSWMAQAVKFLSETHTNIKTLITDLQFPVSDWDEKWVDEYLDSSVKLLDICIALTSEFSRLDQGHLLLQYALHISSSSIDSPSPDRRAHGSLHEWTQQINSRNPKLEESLVILQGLAGTLYVAKAKNSGKGKVLMRALYGAKVVTVYFCSAIAAVLLGCSKKWVELHVISDEFLWAESFNGLRSDVNGEIGSRNLSVPKEIEAVKSLVERLHVLACSESRKEKEALPMSNGVDHEEVTCNKLGVVEEDQAKWRELASDLAGEAEKLAEGIDRLSKQVNDFFQIVLTGRDALLCNFREPDVMEEDIAE